MRSLFNELPSLCSAWFCLRRRSVLCASLLLMGRNTPATQFFPRVRPMPRSPSRPRLSQATSLATSRSPMK
ncbi:hypothetical protein C8R45DRAFT_1080356 [Mycena sanguinolenta]|nr:hypothetical protein C8R45DRAFT_1080356 [Mycena sanguinolenta]